MASPISVKIEVPSLMKKYLEFQSELSGDIIEFSRKHQYNILLLKLVSNYRFSEINQEDENFTGDSYVKIRLPFSDRKDVYFYNYMSRQSKITFRHEVNLDFLYEFKRFIRNSIMQGQQRKIAIEQFLEKYNISEDELKYESLYRKYTRYLNKSKLTL